MTTAGPYNASSAVIISNGGASWEEGESVIVADYDVASVVSGFQDDPPSEVIQALFADLPSIPSDAVIQSIVLRCGVLVSNLNAAPNFSLFDGQNTSIGPAPTYDKSTALWKMTFSPSAPQSALIRSAWNGGTLRGNLYCSDSNNIVEDEVRMGAVITPGGHLHIESITYTSASQDLPGEDSTTIQFCQNLMK